MDALCVNVKKLTERSRAVLRIFVSLFFVMYATTAHANIVEQAQRLLTHLGYNVGVIDGLYGGKTERALTDFYNIQGC